jgi:hypothetical protein
MSVLRSVALVALVLVSASIVVASPVFATPNITASSGTTAVSPFITPIGNTRSLSVGSSTNSSLVLPTLSSTVSCTTSTIAGYVATTNTQLKLTSMSFGGGNAARNCRVSPAGTIDNRPDITCTATSSNPWFLHLRNLPSATSAAGTINPTSSCTVRVTIGGAAVVISVDANQSCVANAGAGNNEYTWNTTSGVGSLVVDCTLTATISNPRSSTSSTFRGTYTVRPLTSTDEPLTMTAPPGRCLTDPTVSPSTAMMPNMGDTQTFTFRNNCLFATLTITANPTLTGPSASDFRREAGSTCAMSLSVVRQATCTVIVTRQAVTGAADVRVSVPFDDGTNVIARIT